LAKTSSEIFNDKVNLIYEYDKKSPLFVRMANSEIENNNVERSIEILNSGLKLYPGFAAAWLILGKALTLTGNYDEAVNAVKNGCSILHSQKTLDFYLKEIELIKKQRSLFRTTRRSAFSIDEELSAINSPDLFESMPAEIPEEKIEEKPEAPSLPVEDRLEQLADEISSAKIPAASNDNEIMQTPVTHSFTNEGKIISETLARIYVAQGEYLEALKVYEKLKAKNPHRADYFDAKIKELKNQPDFLS
jgi:tetratricopeptide (TPR) repeat protein